MHIRLYGPDRCIHLLSAFEARRTSASGGIEAGAHRHWDDFAARAFLLQHCRGVREMGALREALARESADPTRMSDDEVIDAAARRLHSGAWHVGYGPVQRATAGSGGSAGVPAGARAAPPAEAPARRRPAPSAPRPAGAAAPAASAAAVPVDSEFHDTDQAAFADVLKRAAQDGQPFCEICAARSRQKAAAA